MQPIVNGLEEQYGEQVDFLTLNALDGGRGEAAFETFQLRGHPSIVLVAPDGSVKSVHLGVVPRDQLEEAIQTVLNSPD